MHLVFQVLFESHKSLLADEAKEELRRATEENLRSGDRLAEAVQNVLDEHRKIQKQARMRRSFHG